MFLHHLATVFLITFSYVNNMARVGTLVLCLHDSADALLEVTSFLFILKKTKSRTHKVPGQQSCSVEDDALELLVA